MGKGRPKQSVTRNRVVNVLVFESEYPAIQKKSAEHSMSVSSFMRSLALGHHPKSTVDCDAVRRIVVADSNLSRLGNLLKLWLNGESPLLESINIELLIKEIRTARDELVVAAKAMDGKDSSVK